MPSHLIITTFKGWNKGQMWVEYSFGICHHFECQCSLWLTLQVKRWGSMQLSNLPQVIQQIRSISRTWTKTGWNESPCALSQHLCWSGQTPTGHWVSLCRHITQRIRKLSSYQLRLEAALPCLRTRQAGPLPWPSTLHFGMPSSSSPPLSLETPRIFSAIQAGAQMGSIVPRSYFFLWGYFTTF